VVQRSKHPHHTTHYGVVVDGLSAALERSDDCVGDVGDASPSLAASKLGFLFAVAIVGDIGDVERLERVAFMEENTSEVCMSPLHFRPLECC
jgi:hypothetical protein